MAKAKNSANEWTLERVFPWLLLAAGVVALAASIMLASEVFQNLKNPTYVPACNLNPILSCTSVADSVQSHAFGFPNYFIGIAGFAAVVTTGVVGCKPRAICRRFKPPAA